MALPSFIFDTSKGETPQSIAQKRALVAQIMGGFGNRPARNVGEGIGNAFASIGQGITANVMNRRAMAGEEAGQAAAKEAMNPIMQAFQSRLDGGFPAAPNPGGSSSMATMPAPDYASARVAQAHGDGSFNGDLRDGIIATAEAIGADPLDLATAISYETAGTFNPTKRGPRTQWGQHRGLIQFGEPQARQHGVDWNNPVGSQLGPDGAIASYFRSSGFKPGMSGLDLYSTINAGAPGRYSASDANNGGAPGDVRDKWQNQMGGHRQKAAALLGAASLPATPAAPQPNNGLTPEALEQWALTNYAPEQASPAVDAVNALGEAQPVSVAENEADILAQEQAMMGQDPMAFQQPPSGTMPLQPQVAAPETQQPAPPMPPAQFVQDYPVQGAQTAQDRGFPEMAGHNPQAIPAPGVDMNMLAQAMSNPFLMQNEGMRALVMGEYERLMQSQDPMRQLDMDYKRAQTQKLQRELSGELGDAAKVQSSTILDDGTSVLVMNDGSRRVLSPSGEVVSGQQAADAIRSARDYTVRNQQDIYSGRRSGTLGADIELGGAAAGAKKGGEKTMEAGFKAWEDYGKLQTSIGNMDEAIRSLDDGAQSGLIYKMLPNITEASASLQNAMDRMGLDVIGSVTFGALSEGEMRLAMQTAAPRDLSPPELRNWLVRKRDAQIKAADMLADAAQYLTRPGNTINGWIEQNRAVRESAEPPEGASEIPSGIDPSDWEFMTPEERRLFQ